VVITKAPPKTGVFQTPANLALKYTQSHIAASLNATAVSVIVSLRLATARVSHGFSDIGCMVVKIVLHLGKSKVNPVCEIMRKTHGLILKPQNDIVV
jgi:hypothetical protein